MVEYYREHGARWGPAHPVAANFSAWTLGPLAPQHFISAAMRVAPELSFHFRVDERSAVMKVADTFPSS